MSQKKLIGMPQLRLKGLLDKQRKFTNFKMVNMHPFG